MAEAKKKKKRSEETHKPKENKLYYFIELSKNFLSFSTRR